MLPFLCVAAHADPPDSPLDRSGLVPPTAPTAPPARMTVRCSIRSADDLTGEVNVDIHLAPTPSGHDQGAIVTGTVQDGVLTFVDSFPGSLHRGGLMVPSRRSARMEWTFGAAGGACTGPVVLPDPTYVVGRLERGARRSRGELAVRGCGVFVTPDPDGAFYLEVASTTPCDLVVERRDAAGLHRSAPTTITPTPGAQLELVMTEP
ncbi:MAG: hypothetical protein ABMB14_06775 [Myxococcota bacterium]